MSRRWIDPAADLVYAPTHPGPVALARCSLPLSTTAVDSLMAVYSAECARVGYTPPRIAAAGHSLYKPGYVTIYAEIEDGT